MCLLIQGGYSGHLLLLDYQKQKPSGDNISYFFVCLES